MYVTFPFSLRILVLSLSLFFYSFWFCWTHVGVKLSCHTYFFKFNYTYVSIYFNLFVINAILPSLFTTKVSSIILDVSSFIFYSSLVKVLPYFPSQIHLNTVSLLNFHTCNIFTYFSPYLFNDGKNYPRHI